MLSTAPKNKAPLYVSANPTFQQDSNGQFNINQRKIVKSSSNYNLMAFNKSPTFRQERTSGEDAKLDASLHRSDSFSSVKFLNEGEKLVSQLCDISLEATEEKGSNQFSNNITVLSREKPHVKEIQLDLKQDESVSTQIVQLAVEACTIAENIAIANKNRPCFKNIQTICEKTKSNVQKPDAAVANLHSQGVPWVIKNFIFSFVRILDGWKGVKELLCEKHESFKRIENQYYSPQIRECFFEWQVSTKNMLENIYKTFSALDAGFQAEQQRYKRFSGINLMALQNKDHKQKQQNIKRGSPGPTASPTTSQPQFNQFYNQWQNTNVHPISQSISQGNIYSQWSAQSTSKVIPFQNPPATIRKNENMEFSKPPIPGNIKILQNKEEIKINPPGIMMPNVGNIAGQPNDGVTLKQSNISTLISENVTSKDVDIKKPSNEAPSFMSNNWSYNNEVYNPYPNYWVNQGNTDTKPLFNNVPSEPGFPNVLNMKRATNVIPPNPGTYVTANVVNNVDGFNDGPDVSSVYMNPGSYNLPMNKGKVHVHSTSADFGTMESITVHNSSMPKDSIATYSKAITNAFPPPLNECSFNLLKKNNAETDSNYSLMNNPNAAMMSSKNIIKCPEEALFTYTDKEWETAIQLAPKFITTIHQSPEESKNDFQRLYSVFEMNKCSENITVTSEPSCIESVSWNKISQQFFGGCSQHEFDLNYLTNSEQCLNIKTEKFDAQTNYSNSGPNSPELANDNKSESIESFEACKFESEFGSMENIKKVKKKNNQNYKYSARKRNDYVAGGIKRMENILVTLWNMDRNWPLDKEPKLADVVKNVITFQTVSDRLKGSCYSDVHQVAGDIRMIFYNAYEYLKVYPDEKLKNQVDKMQESFEKMFSEEIINKDQKGKPKKRNDFYN